MMFYFSLQPPPQPTLHTHRHKWFIFLVNVKFLLISISGICNNSPSLTCWALFCPGCLQGFYCTPVCWTGLDLSWASVFSVVPASWWLGAAALSMKKKKYCKPSLSSNTYIKASVDAFIMLHISPAPFIHVSTFPQRCAHIKCVQPCHLHRSVYAPTHKHVHISMLSWVCERQLGVNCTRVWRNEDWWLMPAVYSRRVSSDSFGSR